jgi:pyruvate/2-oxoglutarate dehydrogenase complex dihydrolipoamide acyltransferase (E2) component
MSDESDPKVLAAGEEWDATKPALAHAEKLGVDIAEVKGTGPGGTVTKGDVIAHAAATKDPSDPGPVPDEPTYTPTAPTAPEVTATIMQSPQGVWGVQILTQHPDQLDVAVNGRAVWRGIA